METPFVHNIALKHTHGEFRAERKEEWVWDREGKGSCGCLMQGRDSEQSHGKTLLRQGLQQIIQKKKSRQGEGERNITTRGVTDTVMH